MRCFRINEHARVEDDDATTSGKEDKKGGNGNPKSDKRKRNEELNKVSEDGNKGVNTIFIKPINKIMFNIQHKPFFEWP